MPVASCLQYGHGNCAFRKTMKQPVQSTSRVGVGIQTRKNQGPASRAMLLIVRGGMAGLQAEKAQASGGLALLKGWCRLC